MMNFVGLDLAFADQVKIEGFGDLNVTTGGETRVHMNDLKLGLTFGPLEIEFKSLLGGGRGDGRVEQSLTPTYQPGVGQRDSQRANKSNTNGISKTSENKVHVVIF
ncbi:uncharacterized protein TNCV_4525161 [Trichonephila clavipes]|nr:uncharacterized protein TNCV_4525161 [Trichonephila clavipes]